MKKQILTEINRTREIMGLGALLLTEQSSIFKFFMKLFKSSGDLMVSLNKTVMKKYGKAVGHVPISTIAKADDMIEVMQTVMKETIPMIRNNGQMMKKRFLGAGIEMTEEQAAKLGKSWTESSDAFVVAIKGMGKTKEITKITDIMGTLIKGGKSNASGIQKPMIEAIENSLQKAGIKNTDDLSGVLRAAGMSDDAVTRIINNIDEFGNIGAGKNLEEIFQVMIQSPSYQKDFLKILKESPEFNKMFKEGMTEAQLGKMIGRSADDALTVNIYKEFDKMKWLFTNKTVPGFVSWTINGSKKIFNFLFGTKAGKGFLITMLTFYGINYLYDQKWAVFGKKKAALTPDVYLEVEDNKEYVKKFGGYSDEEAIIVANALQEAIEGNILGPYDSDVVDIYKNMPSILACSQVCYFWEKKPETRGSLYNSLVKDLSIDALPRPVSVNLLGDITMTDVKDAISTKQWTTSSSSTSKAAFKKSVEDNWPQFPGTLKLDGDTWYSRLNGPIEGDILGVLLQACVEGSSMEDCLRLYDPETFNSAYSTIRPKSTKDVYTPVQPEEIEETTTAFFDDFLGNIEDSDEEGPTTIDVVSDWINQQMEH